MTRLVLLRLLMAVLFVLHVWQFALAWSGMLTGERVGGVAIAALLFLGALWPTGERKTV